jgi:glycogen operon protein
MLVWPGKPYPLGATWNGEGVNFALFSEHARGVELCLFDEAGGSEVRVPLRERSEHVWHAYLPEVRPGQIYGYRVDGPWEPEQGHRFNRNKLVVDPYAKAFSGEIDWSDDVFGYTIGSPDADLTFDERDSAGFVPKGVVIDTSFTWEGDRAPRIPWHRTVIYECSVRGLTIQHPDVPEDQRGRFLGLASEPIIEHLQSLGVTAVELLPVHHFISERRLVEAGLTNYWGYNTLGFFAPSTRYAGGTGGRHVAEFKTMVKKLHRAGIEVILDVVYNHTCESDHLGPTLCMRGIDNEVYYRLAEDKRYLMDYTGCGNSLDVSHPRVAQLVLDSLRYWVSEMHVDGFRFDLAPVLGRGKTESDPFGALFDIMLQDPVISEVKLIAEPWDVGPGGWKLGAFPTRWGEWNAAYRDALRRFWRGDRDMVPELASRLSGSADIFGDHPNRSINFITCHDGFSLHDVVSYEQKHNEANAEDGRDGHGDNHSCNWGVEGSTTSEEVIELRERVKRSLFATLMLSQGVPMLSAGDEFGRTQHGNNNAYCQDNELSWLDWNLGKSEGELLEFSRVLMQIHRDHPVLRRRSFFGVHRDPREEVIWLRPDGEDMSEDDWNRSGLHTLGMLLHGEAGDEQDERGRPVVGETLLLLLNGGNRPRRFTLPEGEGWIAILDTARSGLERTHPATRQVRQRTLRVLAHSLMLLVRNADR